LDPAALAKTLVRFNEFADAGQDEDFGRGDSAYDRYYGDPRQRPNPNLAPLRQAPYYAVKIVPGDLGTKGGLRTDARARVLREDGTPIAGGLSEGPALQALAAPEAILELLHGMSGHLVSSTRGLPK